MMQFASFVKNNCVLLQGEVSFRLLVLSADHPVGVNQLHCPAA